MRKEEFFKQLEYLLQDIPDADREEAMEYYRDYLAEAGPEKEEEIIEDFGSPERVAAIIRADVTGNLKDGGSFTEKGYVDERFQDPNYQVAKRLDLPEEREEEYERAPFEHTTFEEGEYRECFHEKPEKEKRVKSVKKTKDGKSLKWILGAVLLVLASPFILGAIGVVIGVMGGILAIALGITVAILGVTAAVFIFSVCLAALGVAFWATTPFDTLFLFGFAVSGIGCGLLGLVLLYLIFSVGCPLVGIGCKRVVEFFAGLGKELKNA